METFLIKAAQLILAFAILVIIHEFGHFLFARLFGVKVEKFYIFFDPWFEIFKWKPGKYFGFFGKSKKNPEATIDSEKEIDKKKSHDKIASRGKRRFWADTEYGIGWLPLGGYCKISGMIDESMDTEQMKQPAKPWEFRTKPAWQRLLIMIAGVLFNFLLAILIYAGITYCWGDSYVPLKESNGLLRYSDAAQNIGYRDGDIPLDADGKPVISLEEDMYALGSASRVRVLRNGIDTITINQPNDFLLKVQENVENDSRGITYIALDFPVIVKEVTSETAKQAGLRVGDRPIAINGESTGGATEFFKELGGKANSTIKLTVIRPKEEKNDTIILNIPLDADSKIGFMLENDENKLFNTTKVEYGLLESFPKGIAKGSKKMVEYVSSLKYLFTKEGAKSVGGFGAIGNMFPESWDWFAFWNIAAFLSVALAFMNILPIPGLDGGHVLFLLYEVIFRRKPSDKFLERAQMIGMALLILLLLYANGMDIVRFFIK